MSASRKNKLRSAILFGFLGLALFAMVITGFGTGGGGIGDIAGGGQQAQTVVEIDGDDLTDAEVSRLLSLAYRQYAQDNPGGDRGQFFREAFDPLLEQMIDGRTMAAFARKLGMVVPQSMVDESIRTDPRFQVGGQFDDAAFRAFLDQANLTERQARAEIEEQMYIQMIAAPVGGQGRVPPAIVRAYADLLLESRTGQIGAVPTEALARSIQPSDEEVARFYQGNQRLFQLPERRVIRYAVIGRDQLGEGVRASDQEVAAYYQQNQARFGPSERRSLMIFTTRDEAAARRVADKVRGGTSFVDAARAEGFEPSDVTFPDLGRDQIVQQTSEEIANAIAGSEQGGLVGPTRTPTGFYKVVRTEAVTRTPGRPLEAVRGEIVAALEQGKIENALIDRVDQFQEQLEDGTSLEELARGNGLQLQTSQPVTSTGAANGGQFPAELAPILQTAFEVEAREAVIESLQEGRQAVLMEVAEIVPPATPPFEQIRDQVRQRLIQQTAAERARQLAEGIVNRINGGMAPDQAYGQAGIPLPPRETRTERRSTIERIGQAAPPPFRILFAIPEGRARMVEAPNNAGWVIVHHQRRVAGNAATDSEGRAATAEAERRLGASGALELVSQFARAIRSVVDVERNEDRINALRESLISGQ